MDHVGDKKAAAADTIIADFDNAFRRAVVDTREKLEALIPGAGADFAMAIDKVVDESLRPGMDAFDLTISRRVAGEADRSRAVQGVTIKRVPGDPLESAREVERVEDHLSHTFAGLGPVERLPSKDGISIWGWSILGGVLIPLGFLPVDGDEDAEDATQVRFRTEILDTIRAAYGAGRDYEPNAEPTLRPPVGHEEGDPAVLWQSRLDANFTTRQMPRVLQLVERIEAVIGERGPVCRILKATPSWQIGETFLRLPDLVEFLSDDAAVQTAVTVADREKALANARAM